MKHGWWFLVLVWTLCASPALGEPPEEPSNKPARAARALVHEKLLAPLAKSAKKRSKFSRAAPVPVAQRVRVLDSDGVADARGKRFVRFAVDSRLPWNDDAHWERDTMLGCAYPDDGRVFVQRGEAHVPAASVLGKEGRADDSACRAAPEAAGAELAVARPER